jgi:hypothetical protein
MTTEEKSRLFKRFVASVEGSSPEWRESVDTESLLALEKDERREAEELLQQRLLVDDWRAPYALAEAESRGSVMPMKRALKEATPRMKIAIAKALAKLEAIPAADPIVAEVLRSGDPDGGLAALVAAEEMTSPEIRDALAWSCVHHPSRVVRVNAGAQLFYMAKLATDTLALPFRDLYIQLGEDDEATRRKAFEEIAFNVGMPPELADS